MTGAMFVFLFIPATTANLAGYQEHSRCLLEASTSVNLGKLKSAQVPLTQGTGLDLCSHFQAFDFKTIGGWDGNFGLTTEYLSKTMDFETGDGVVTAKFLDAVIYGTSYTLENIPDKLPTGTYLVALEYIKLGNSSLCIIAGWESYTIAECKLSMDLYCETYDMDCTNIPSDVSDLPSDYVMLVLKVQGKTMTFQATDFERLTGEVITKPDKFMSGLYQSRVQIMSDCQFHYQQVWNLLQTFITDKSAKDSMEGLLAKLPRFEGNLTKIAAASQMVQQLIKKNRTKRSLLFNLFGEDSQVEAIRLNTNLHTKNIQLLDENERKIYWQTRNISRDMGLLANESVNFQRFVRTQLLREHHQGITQRLASLKMREVTHYSALAVSIRQQVEQEARKFESLLNTLANPKQEHCFTTDQAGYFCKNTDPATVELHDGVPVLQLFGSNMATEKLLLARCLPRSDGKIFSLNHNLLRQATEGFLMGPTMKVPVVCLTTQRKDCDEHFELTKPEELPRTSGAFYIVDSATEEVRFMSEGTAAVKVVTTSRQIQLGLTPVLLARSDFPIQIGNDRVQYSDLTLNFKTHTNVHKSLFSHPRDDWVSIFADSTVDQAITARDVNNFSLEQLYNGNPVVKYMSIAGLVLTGIIICCALTCCIYICRTVQICIEMSTLCNNFFRLLCCICRCRSHESVENLNDAIRRDGARVYGRVRRGRSPPPAPPARAPPPDYAA